jgi:transcriptional regulator with XRE-family HTH domain
MWRRIVNASWRILVEVAMNPERFAGRLRELRVAKGWTQGELAERAGLTKAGVANLEQGRREPSWSTVLALAEALVVSCDDFHKPGAGVKAPGRGRPKKSKGK